MTHEPYTPTVEEARERYVDGFPIDTWMVAREEEGEAFDRMIATVRAEGEAAGRAAQIELWTPEQVADLRDFYAKLIEQTRIETEGDC